MSKRFQWKLKHREILLGERALLMGVLNITPDSFSDGGKYMDPDLAVARALEMQQQGADLIDIGAESTKPGSQRVPEAEEIRRLVPVLKRLQGKISVPISVDTYKSAVAAKALEHGAEIVNDPTGLLLDLQLPKVVNKYDAGLIINHMRGSPETWSRLPPIKNLMLTICIDMEAALNRARQGGVSKHQLAIDPGLGFGKRHEQNSEIIARLDELRTFDVPIVIGPSRKSFLKKENETETEFASAGAVAACILNGANIVRVHDIVSMKNVFEVVNAIVENRAPEEDAAAEPQRARVRPPLPQGPEDQRQRLRPRLRDEPSGQGR